MKPSGRPLRFIVLTIGLWIGGRVVVLSFWGERQAEAAAEVEREEVAHSLPAPPAAVGPIRSHDVPGRRPGSGPEAIARGSAPALPRGSQSPSGPRPAPGDYGDKNEEGAEAVAAVVPVADVTAGSPQPALLRPAAPPSRWSASAWLFLREGGGGQLATGGQLGGAQAGARAAWRIDDAARLALFGRVSGPLRGRGFEAASGIEWRPLGGVPVRLAAERRVALEPGGRDAFAAYAFGGVDAMRLGGLRLDAYGQAGAVGLRSRDLFADGSVRVGRELALSRRTSVTLGAGAWGAAQPGAARLDVGPQAVVRFPAGDLGLALAIDWRLRAAGQARPGSGPTVTLGVDF